MNLKQVDHPRGTDDAAIRVLLVDDSPLDAELCLKALQRAGMLVDSVTVENEPQLRATLLAFVPDIVLCDFSFPNFDGFAAQRIVRETYPDCPLIFVSGAISEESAAMALQSGAVDYVMKSTLVRLPIAVERAVRTAKIAAHVETRVRWHRRRLETLWRIANDPAMSGAELSHEMLCRAALDLSAVQSFRSFLCGTNAAGLIIDRSSRTDVNVRAAEEMAALRALRDATFVDGVRTRSWSDVACAADAPGTLRAAGWRAVTCTHFESNGSTYWLTFASTDVAATAFSDDDFAYLNVLGSSFANQVQVNALEKSLRDEEERSRQHAQRLEALWQIVNDVSLGDPDKWLAMLSQAAKSIWPGQGYRGMLWRIEGADMTLEAVGESPNHRLAIGSINAGAVLPVAASVVGIVYANGGGTRSWDDVQSSAPSLDLASAQGAHSCIVTTFSAGGATWALMFASGRITSRPLGALEHAYIEVLASFFSNHVQQRWQFAQIQYQQSHDLLTGLLSRSEFRSQACGAAGTSTRYAIIVVDINAFHEMNESYGHTIGDAVLVEVANALSACAEPGEIVGRVGGDVFAVYVANPPSREFVLRRARDFANVFARSFSIGDGDRNDVVTRSASLGVAIAPEDGAMIDAILSNADAALAVAKERGHGSLVSYEAGMERDAQRRATLRNELAEAVVKDQFMLYFQPHVEIGTGRTTGCEALIRWDHPQRGLLPPGHFIPFAEQAGIIASIDKWVMRNAFAAAEVLSESRPDFRLYFNLSGRQAGDPAIVRAFVDAARSGVPLGNIGVEITETDAMRDVTATQRVCRTLRRLGVRIAIDDFGTGYSSLSSLKQLSIDIVKIDRSFISGVTSNADDSAIAKTIISIADHFGFESLAEGAETLEQVDWLRRQGCRYVHGYAISYPLPFDAFRRWLVEHDARLAAPPTCPVDRRRHERRAPENVPSPKAHSAQI